MSVCYYHVTYTFQSEFPLYICLNVKELLARNRSDIWSLSDCNGTRIHNHLVLKRTLNHLAKLTKWLSCAVSTFLHGAFECILLSCHVHNSEWIHTPYLPECQGFFARKRRNIWSSSDYNGTRTHNHLVRKRTLNNLAKVTKWLSCVVSTFL